MQICKKGTCFYVQNSKCTGFGIHRVLLYVSKGKEHSDQAIVRIKGNFGIHKIRNRQIIRNTMPLDQTTQGNCFCSYVYACL